MRARVARAACNENTQLAPSENRSSNSADGRVATVTTRLEEKISDHQKPSRTHLTPTGLLMEGDYTHNPGRNTDPDAHNPVSE